MSVTDRDRRVPEPRRDGNGVPWPESPSGQAEPDGRARRAAIAARYTPVDWAEVLAGGPRPADWLVEPVLERGSANVLYGGVGVGKSLIALLEITMRVIRAGHVVLYVDEENGAGVMADRLLAHGATADELARLVMYCYSGLPSLDTPAGGEHLLALAEAAGAALVIIDTTTRLIDGRENDADTFLQLSRHSIVPLKQRGVTVLRLDHPGKDPERGQRGSSAKDGDVDTIWRLTGHTATVLRLEREKNRRGRDTPPVVVLRRVRGALRYEWSHGGAEMSETSARILDVLNAQNVPISTGRPAARKILDAAGLHVSNAQLEAALRLRKNCPGQDAGSAGSDPLALLPPPPHIGGGSRAGLAPDSPRPA